MAIFSTGSGVGDTYATVLLTLPDVDWFKQNIVGAVNAMTIEFNWSENGDVGISFATEESQKMLESMVFMAFNPFPPGMIFPFGSVAAPPGYLLCDGSSYAADDYPELFAAIGYSFGGAGGSFNVPQLIDRVAVGAGGAFDIGAAGGESTVTLDITQMPAHTHSDAGHSHSYTPPGTTIPVVAPGEAPVLAISLLPGITGTGFASIQPTGGDGAHNNMQPFQAVPYIIYAGR